MTINVQESTARQWFFVASDCTLDAPAIKMDYKITSTGAVDCSSSKTILPSPDIGTIQGTIRGDFGYMGSFCFPAGSTATATIDVTGYSPESNIVVLFYDDQSDSFASLNKPNQSCEQRQSLSKKLCSGPDSCVTG
jgi:hypothetical protein